VLTREALASADLVVVDERAWLTLGESERETLDAAVRSGLGLLLRVNGPVDDAVAADWSRFGFRIESAGEPRAVTLDGSLALDGRTSFTAARVRVAATSATPLLATDEGDAIVEWRTYGRGRVGVWLLVDSYDLVLLGESARHGTLWSRTVSALARARPASTRPRLPAAAWVGERAVICAASGGARDGEHAPAAPAPGGGANDGDGMRVVAADGAVTALILDADGCGAYWPTIAGWHRLEGSDDAFYVRDRDDGATLRAARDARETAALVEPWREAPAVSVASVPMSRWPFFAGWMLLAGALWWRERRGAAS
jgi:hypothetical protein